jgi:hypothetical protein
MAEIAFIQGVGWGFFLVLVLVLVLVWLLSRRIRRWFGRSLKARQDLARAMADIADRLERIEDKLEKKSNAAGTNGIGH